MMLGTYFKTISFYFRKTIFEAVKQFFFVFKKSINELPITVREFRLIQLDDLLKFIFGIILSKRSISSLKQKKRTSPLKFAYSNYSKHQLSAENDNFYLLGQIRPKTVLPIKNRKSKHHHWTLHIGISQGIKFQVKLRFFFMGQVWPKKNFWSKAEKVNTTIEFCIFELI